jgi:hypothetical protein
MEKKPGCEIVIEFPPKEPYLFPKPPIDSSAEYMQILCQRLFDTRIRLIRYEESMEQLLNKAKSLEEKADIFMMRDIYRLEVIQLCEEYFQILQSLIKH